MRLVLAAAVLLLAAFAPPVHAQARVRPSWGEAWLASAATGAGLLAGGAVGVQVESALTPPENGGFTGLLGATGGGTLGAAAGALGMRGALGQRRGSVLGAVAGTVGGVFVGAMLPTDPYGYGNAVLMPALCAVGGAVGYRYGPWAKGPARHASVSVVPVATPHGAGGYAVVRF